MRRAIALFAALSVFLCSCAGSWRQQAVRYGSVAKEVVDVGARSVSQHVEHMAMVCEREQELALYESCLGPVAGDPDRTMAVFESVRAAQLALFVAIAADDHTAALVALAELKQRLKKAAELVQAAQARP